MVGEVRPLAGERAVPTGGVGLTSEGPPANCPMRVPRPEELQTARPPFLQRAGWGILPWRLCPLRGSCRLQPGSLPGQSDIESARPGADGNTPPLRHPRGRPGRRSAPLSLHRCALRGAGIYSPKARLRR
jgi:hypothetical protein